MTSLLKLACQLSVFAIGCIPALYARSPQSSKAAAISATAPASLPESYSGGETTVFIEGQKAFSRPLANIKPKSRRLHSVGNSFFNQNWIEAPASVTSRDGLGPLFNARSCSACHAHDGKGFIPTRGQHKSGMVTRLRILNRVGKLTHHPIYGGQLADRALLDLTPEAHIVRDFESFLTVLSDGQTYQLRRPAFKISGLPYGPLEQSVQLSHLLAPPVFGLGLVEAITSADLLARADPHDADQDGISGRPHYVWNLETQRSEIGRFGWKATQPTLKQQSADAFLNDIGITSSLFPEESTTPVLLERYGFKDLQNGGSPELSDASLELVTAYLATLAPPARRDIDKPSVKRGQALFHDLKCAACHTPKYTTGKHPAFSELSHQTIYPYSDFLLHDMGDDLADRRLGPETGETTAGGVSEREWRTPPLWGIGLQAAVSKHSFFLHDGRAKNVIEAILWHGGEAAASREEFLQLDQSSRRDLFDFLMSL